MTSSGGIEMEHRAKKCSDSLFHTNLALLYLPIERVSFHLKMKLWILTLRM